MEGLKAKGQSKSKSQRKINLSKDKKPNTKRKVIEDTRRTFDKNRMFDSKIVLKPPVDRSDQDSVSTNSEFTNNAIRKDFCTKDTVTQNDNQYIRLPVITNTKSDPIDSTPLQQRNKIIRRYKNASMRINDYPGGTYGSQNSIATTHTGRNITYKLK